MNLHSSFVALLNIATEDLVSAGAGVGEHCHLQLGKQQEQGHKSQIKEMAVGLQTARALVLYLAQLGCLAPWRGGWSLVHAVLFIANLAFSLLCLERLSKTYSREMNLFW